VITALMGYVLLGLVRPLGRIESAMRRLAAGEKDVETLYRNRRDELGSMSDALDVLRRTTDEADNLRASQAAVEAKTAAERRTAMLALADRFDADVSAVVSSVVAAIQQLNSSAVTLNSATTETTSQSSAV